jgi:hypothetical protein
MELTLDVLRVINLVVAAFLAGGQMFCLIALLPAMPGWAPAMSARVHADAMTDRPHRFLRICGAVSLISAIALMALLARSGQTLALVPTAGGFLATVISSVISSKEWPINEEIKSWGQEPKLERYAELRRLWDLRHVRRTWLSLAGFVFFAIASVVGRTL